VPDHHHLRELLPATAAAGRHDWLLVAAAAPDREDAYLIWPLGSTAAARKPARFFYLRPAAVGGLPLA
jgi:hypothetical protein